MPQVKPSVAIGSRVLFTDTALEEFTGLEQVGRSFEVLLPEKLTLRHICMVHAG